MLLHDGTCAIIISGYLRDFVKYFPSFKECILDHNNCHIYMQIYASELDRIQKAVQLYKPQRILVEEPIKDFVFEGEWNTYTNREGYYWQCKNLKTAFGLVPDYYPCVVRTRYDLKYTSPIKFLSFNLHHIHIPAHRIGLYGYQGNGITDVFAFSSYENMRYYTSLYDYINHYVKQGVECTPEVLLMHHLRDKSLVRPIFPIFLRDMCMTTPHGHHEFLVVT